MDAEETKWRRCSRCEYKELRGSRQGAFIAGQFVCDACFWDAQMRGDKPEPVQHS